MEPSKVNSHIYLFIYFLKTELGHSSNLRSLETTASYDSANKEWIIHSPTLTATKWWIGMSGETATHTGNVKSDLLV
jgi:acyl-CoA oxidase